MRKILTALVAAGTISATAIARAADGWGWWVPGAMGRRDRNRRYRRECTGATAVLPVWLPVPVLRTSLPKRLERLRLGTRLLVTN